MFPPQIQKLLDNYAKEYRCKDWFDFRFKHSPENIMSIHFEQIMEGIAKHYESVNHPQEFCKEIFAEKKCDYDHSKLELYGGPCPKCGIIQGADMK